MCNVDLQDNKAGSVFASFVLANVQGGIRWEQPLQLGVLDSHSCGATSQGKDSLYRSMVTICHARSILLCLDSFTCCFIDEL